MKQRRTYITFRFFSLLLVVMLLFNVSLWEPYRLWLASFQLHELTVLYLILAPSALGMVLFFLCADKDNLHSYEYD